MSNSPPGSATARAKDGHPRIQSFSYPPKDDNLPPSFSKTLGDEVIQKEVSHIQLRKLWLGFGDEKRCNMVLDGNGWTENLKHHTGNSEDQIIGVRWYSMERADVAIWVIAAIGFDIGFNSLSRRQL
ncbi:hypothetical protein PTKIN_Ptkin16aG0481500 [Pterospermum kingtungense]